MVETIQAAGSIAVLMSCAFAGVAVLGGCLLLGIFRFSAPAGKVGQEAEPSIRQRGVIQEQWKPIPGAELNQGTSESNTSTAQVDQVFGRRPPVTQGRARRLRARQELSLFRPGAIAAHHPAF